MVKMFFKQNWPSLLIVVAWAILTGLSKLELSFTWMSNVNIWANAIILDLLLFQVMTIVTIKIKNVYWQSLISLIITLIVGESIKYNFNYLDVSIFNIISISLFSILLIVYSFIGFKMGIEKGVRDVKKEEHRFNDELRNMDHESRKKLIREVRRSVNFVKKYKFSAGLIKDLTYEELEEFLEDVSFKKKNNK